MTENELAVIAGVIFSLLASYFPRFDTWFAGKSKTDKRLFMLALLTATATGIFGIGCLGWFAEFVSVTCNTAGAAGLVKILVIAIIANQSVYGISPESQKVTAAKEKRYFGTVPTSGVGDTPKPR